MATSLATISMIASMASAATVDAIRSTVASARSSVLSNGVPPRFRLRVSDLYAVRRIRYRRGRACPGPFLGSFGAGRDKPGPYDISARTGIDGRGTSPHCRLSPHQRAAAADGDDLVAVVVCGMLELDDAAIRPRLAVAHGDDHGTAAQRVAVEHRLREAHVGHAEIGDRRPERRVVDAHADHEAEREEAVDDALAELGAGGEMRI